MELSPEQALAFRRYRQGANLFITGPGGTGKTALIRKIYRDAILSGNKIAVCALTGCAAHLLECNARTIHSWAGIGLATESANYYVEKIAKSHHKRKQWQTTQILIIDEVSMMPVKLFDLLNAIGKRIRKRPDVPFGGLQVIMSGDFYQLPPVVRMTDEDRRAGSVASRFCFESEDWWSIFGAAENVVELVTIFRQKDPQYAAILNQLREGIIKRSSIALLAQQVNKPRPADLLIQPTKLFPRRDQVDALNAAEMAALNETGHVYTMMYEIEPSYTYGTGATVKAAIADATKNINTSKALKAVRVYSDSDMTHEFEYMCNSILCDRVLELKKGAQVMCIVNAEFPAWMGGVGVAEMAAATAVAATEHVMVGLYNGCQGVVVDFVGGGAGNAPALPVVRFYRNGEKGVDVLMRPHMWNSDRLSGLSIKQLPLVLSWAITIHKSQGATLDHAEIDIGHAIFEDGQTYVALSRVSSIGGLYLSAFDPTKIRVNVHVRNFYARLRAERDAAGVAGVAGVAATCVATAAPAATDTKTVVVR